MKNPIAKIKNYAKDHASELTAGAIVGTLAGGAYVFGIVVHKYVVQKDAIIIPATVVNHMKACEGGFLGVDVIKGYDVLVKLIPVKS